MIFIITPIVTLMRIATMIHVMIAMPTSVIAVALGHVMAHCPMAFAASFTLFCAALAAHHRFLAFAMHLMTPHFMIVESNSGRGDRQCDRSG